MSINSYYIIAPLSALSNRTRLYKLAMFLSARYPSLKLHHIGWERVPGESVEKHLAHVAINKELIIRGGGYGGKSVRLLYPIWMVLVFFRCLMFRKTDLVWALGFETAFPAMIAQKCRRFTLVFDDADRFSMLFGFSGWIKGVLEKLERWTSRNSTVHIIPGRERYDFSSDKFRIVKNTPSTAELCRARTFAVDSNRPAAKVVLNVNGWLGDGRGMETVLELALALENRGLHIILAGKIDCQAAHALSQLPNVTYLGRVSNAEALASYSISDFVFTYYNPSLSINLYAESNKWGDAVMTGVGVVVNSEVLTAGFLIEAGAAISVPYSDTAALIEVFSRLCSATEEVLEFKARSAALAHLLGAYETQLQKIFDEINP